MGSEKIDEEIRGFENKHENNWQRTIYVLRRHLDIWGQKRIRPHWGTMKLSWFPVVFNISVDGSTAGDISRRSMVIKQSMSRTIKELEDLDIITRKAQRKDKRSDLLCLTQLGKELALDAHKQLEGLNQSYIDLVGEHDLRIAEKVLQKIIAYHESLNETDEDDFEY